MKCSWISPGQPEWTDLLENVRFDIYHLPEYVKGAATIDGSVPVGFLAESAGFKLFIPLLVRQIQQSLLQDHPCKDAISPYGYPGPLTSGPSGPGMTEFLNEAVHEFVDALAAQRIISVFVRLHPLTGVSAEQLRQIATGEIIEGGQTVAVDLSQSDEEIWKQVRSGHRNEINRARRENQRFRVVNPAEHLDAFIEIYEETMCRVNASTSYFFPKSYYESLCNMRGTEVSLVIIEIEGTIAAASLLTETNGIVQYHLSGTRTEFLRSRPTKLLLFDSFKWARSRKNSVFHLGGGLGGNADSLFDFKAGFSKERHMFSTWRVIGDPEIYSNLVLERQQSELRENRIWSPPEKFFPLYRA